MPLPKISIITVCYNSEKTLEETIKSIISQDYSQLEYIIIDGSSTDNTMDIVNKYLEHINVVVSEKDHGISDAFNKGILHSTGDVIGIINSDDILLPGTLNRLAQEYNPTTDIYRMNVLIWNPETDERFRERPSMHFPKFPLTIHIAHQGTFVSASAYRKYGMFDIKLRFMMDADLLMRAYRSDATFKYIDYDSSLYRIGGATASDLKKKKSEFIYLITTHSGSSILGHLYYYYKYLRELVKKALDFFGSDAKRILGYKSIGKSPSKD